VIKPHFSRRLSRLFFAAGVVWESVRHDNPSG